MDIDCDGQQGGAGDDGRCGSSEDTQSETSFKDTVAGYGIGVKDLDAKVHPYVVFGNDGTVPSFDPKRYGIQPLGVMAVVCGNPLVGPPSFPLGTLLTWRSRYMEYGETRMAMMGPPLWARR